MGRVIFPAGLQSAWIITLLKEAKVKINEIAKICGVTPRTCRDWRRGKYTISKKALLKLSKLFSKPIPSEITCVDDFWYVKKGARKGAIRRLEIYGPPGTIESRRKGGRISQQRRKENPGKYRRLGCIVKKDFILPRKSVELAEIVGIILGDGGVTQYQLKITLDRKNDRDYATYVRNLTWKVFGELPTYKERSGDNTINLTISGVGLIENLLKLGIEKGNKIVRQVDFPAWIWGKSEYQIACVRGLLDTDGGIFFHRHWTKGIKYRNLGLCFTSWSKPLLMSTSKVLKKFRIKHSVREKGYIFIYDLNEIKKYFDIFQPHNSKFIEKLKFHEENSRIIEKTRKGGVA